MEKIFTVDWDSEEQVRALFLKAKSQYFNLRQKSDNTFKSKSETQRDRFHAAHRIWEADMREEYASIYGSSNKEYYVYAHLNVEKPIVLGERAAGIPTFAASIGMKYMPFYVGKGIGRRAYDLNRNDTHRKIRSFLRERGKDAEVCIVKDGLSEIEALILEDKLIDIFGIKTFGGMLANLDEGFSPEIRRKKYYDDYTIVAGPKAALTFNHRRGRAAAA